MIIERRVRAVAADSSVVFRSFARLGGDRGWLYLDWTSQLRGMLDRLCGGVGMRRGRRDPENLRVGDALDFWRVEAVEPGRLVRLRAEMRVPGRVWLEFQAAAQPDGRTLLTQTAFFEPKGLPGLLYWYALHPVHSLTRQPSSSRARVPSLDDLPRARIDFLLRSASLAATVEGPPLCPSRRSQSPAAPIPSPPAKPSHTLCRTRVFPFPLRPIPSESAPLLRSQNPVSYQPPPQDGVLAVTGENSAIS